MLTAIATLIIGLAAEAPADSLDVSLEPAGPLSYLASEVLVVADRPDRFDVFAAEAVPVGPLPSHSVVLAPHVSGGDYGTSAFPSVRGLPAEHVAVEFDGIPLNSVQNGTFDLALLDLLGQDPSITRGPFAWLGATGASHAAVVLGARRPQGMAMNVLVGEDRGSLRMGVGGHGGGVSLAVEGSDGPRDGESLAGWSAQARGQLPFGEVLLASLSARRGLPGASDAPWSAGVLDDELAFARLRFDEVGRARPTLYAARHEQHYEDSYSAPTHVVSSGGGVIAFDADRDGAFRALLAAAGEFAVLESSDPVLPDLGRHVRGSGSLIARATVGSGSLRSAAQCGMSLTSDFGAAVSGALSAAAVGPRGRAWISAGSSYRPPTMNELHWPADPWTEGNPELDPERLTSGEAGVSLPFGLVTVGGVAYRSAGRGLIVWQEDGAVWRPVNVGSAVLEGVELDARLTLGAFSAWYAGDFARATDGRSGLGLPYRPESQHTFGARAELRGASLEVGVRSAGRAFTNAANTETIDGYTVADAALAVPLPLDGVRAVLEVGNLFDEAWATRRGYALPGRAWRAGLLITQLQNPW